MSEEASGNTFDVQQSSKEDVPTGDSPAITPPTETPMKERQSKKKCRCKFNRRYLGILYALLAVNVNSIGSCFTKKYNKISFLTLMFYGFPVCIILCLLTVLYALKCKKEPVLDTVFPLTKHKIVLFFLWLRSVTFIGLLACIIKSFDFIEVSDARTIFAASVILVNIAGSIFFKEKLGIVTLVMCLVAMIGIVFISRPSFLFGGAKFDWNNLIGIGLASVSMLCTTTIMLSLRFLHVYHGVVNLFCFSIAFITVLPAVIMLEQFEIPDWHYEHILWVFGFGLVQVTFNMLLSLSLQLERVGVIAIVRTTEITFTLLWQWVINKTIPIYWTSWAGSSIVMFAVVVVGVRLWVEGHDDTSKVKKCMWWILK